MGVRFPRQRPFSGSFPHPFGRSTHVKTTRIPSTGYVTYNEAHTLLVDAGFAPFPGSSRYTKASGDVGRIKEGPGTGDAFFVETVTLEDDA